MSVTIYHNPKCSTSRTVLAMIREAGIEPKVVEYLKTPLDRAALTDLVKRMKAPVRDLIRQKEPEYRKLHLDDPGLDDVALIAAIAEHPVLLDRPIVVTRSGARLCRPAATVKDLL